MKRIATFQAVPSGTHALVPATSLANMFRAYAIGAGHRSRCSPFLIDVQATPITYMGADGRQYVTVVSTGGGLTGSEATNDEVIAFALREN